MRRREVFGPLRLHYGFFKLWAKQSEYLIARQDQQIVGAVGYTRDPHDNAIRVFELISFGDQVIRFLLQQLEARYGDDPTTALVEIDVNAHAPRMQRTLLEMGFLPAAYIPALAFDRVERVDVVRMSRLLVPLELGEMRVDEQTERIADLVTRGFSRRDVLARVDRIVDRVAIFEGLSDEQVGRLGALFEAADFEAGEVLFEPDDPADETYVVLEGRVAIEGPRGERLGEVTPGECVGEVAMLCAEPHSVGARALTDLELAMLRCERMTELVRRRPDIGVVLYRNLAREVGEKLRRADRLLREHHRERVVD